MQNASKPVPLAEPDLVDRMFDYLLEAAPEFAGAVSEARLADAKVALRQEFRGENCYIPVRGLTERQRLTQEILARFNGRNAREIARALGISRATVYRVLRQPGGRVAAENRLTFSELETAAPIASAPPADRAPELPACPSPVQTSTPLIPPLPPES